MKKDCIAMLLAGGTGTRLNILVSSRAKPAIPFGGIYRIIDFTMSNLSNSGVDVVGVLTQYKPLSLMDHIDNGRPWDLFGRTRLVEILPPKTGEEISDWYKGTSDAIYQNLGFINEFSPEVVLVVSGDHIYHMDYNRLLQFHREKDADVTICLIRVPIAQTHHFGIAEVNKEAKIINWIEKPTRAESNLASMGIYLFNKESLEKSLIEVAKRGGNDFARDVIPLMLKGYNVYGYEFSEYWRDVGTIDAYWDTNMDLLRPNSGLNIEQWRLKTNLFTKGEIGDRPSPYFGNHCRVENSLISRGCIIEGVVKNSIISPGGIIEKESLIEDSIIFHDTKIGQASIIKKCIIDKNVEIGKNIKLGPIWQTRRFFRQSSSGITLIGKGVTMGTAHLNTSIHSG